MGPPWTPEDVYRQLHCPPKAEVTSSNLVGRASASPSANSPFGAGQHPSPKPNLRCPHLCHGQRVLRHDDHPQATRQVRGADISKSFHVLKNARTQAGHMEVQPGHNDLPAAPKALSRCRLSRDSRIRNCSNRQFAGFPGEAPTQDTTPLTHAREGSGEGRRISSSSSAIGRHSSISSLKSSMKAMIEACRVTSAFSAATPGGVAEFQTR